MKDVLPYVTNGILTAMLWAHFFWFERSKRQLSIKSICILIFMQAVTFGGLRLILLQRENKRPPTKEELIRQFEEFDRQFQPSPAKPADAASGS
jgi:hypothetical protein